MYSIGDRIVYPMYGAGVVEDVEKQDVDGQEQLYYVVVIPVGNLKIKISAVKAEGLGLRKILDKDKVTTIIRTVNDEPLDMPENWNQRYKENMERIKTGRLAEVALVFRNLLLREKVRGLSSAEKKMLTTAKHIIISEMILSCEIEKSTAEELLSEAVS